MTARLFGEPLLSIYIKESPTAAEAIGYGLTRMTWICVPYLFCGLMDVMTGALRGMGASYIPMIVSILGVCVFRVVWIFTVFRMYRTPETLYASYLISWTLTMLVELVCFVVLYGKMKRNVQ